MPGKNRIRRLLDLLPGDLSQAKLDTLSRKFDALAQDSAEVPPFFVLHLALFRSLRDNATPASLIFRNPTFSGET